MSLIKIWSLRTFLSISFVSCRCHNFYANYEFTFLYLVVFWVTFLQKQPKWKTKKVAQHLDLSLRKRYSPSDSCCIHRGRAQPTLQSPSCWINPLIYIQYITDRQRLLSSAHITQAHNHMWTILPTFLINQPPLSQCLCYSFTGTMTLKLFFGCRLFTFYMTPIN